MAKRATAVSFASVPLNESTSEPLYRQLYDRLRTAILMGQLSPGTRLPSTREMAAELGISRNTVMNAFDQLLAEGYIEGHVGAGTFVARALPDDLLQARADAKHTLRFLTKGRSLSQRGKVLAGTSVAVTKPAGKMRPFIPGTPALDEFPMGLWSSLVSRRWRKLPSDLLDYSDAAGYRPLREAIAAYLGPSRAVRCEPEQVIIVPGSQQALDLAARVLLDRGDAALVEECSYAAARAALAGAGVRLIPVPVDDEGLDISAVTSRDDNARMVYITPSHQYPLGVTMSLTRRLTLLDWASRSRAWILEDDYDSEYRYVGRPLSALQGLDREGRVIYLGTFSKVLFPSLRHGYMVVPPDLVAAFTTARATIGWCSPVMDQAVLTDFITEGHFARHIRRMRLLYTERQAALVEATGRECGSLLKVQPSEAGIHLMGWLPDGTDDRAVRREAAAHGVVVQPLSSFVLKGYKLNRSGLVLGYGGYDVGQINEAVGRMAAALRAVSHNSRSSVKQGRRLR